MQRRAKSLLLPYFLYNAFYLGVTVLIAKLTGKFWGMPISLKNFFITPFLNGHQFDLSCPLWFVTQLFMTMMVFAIPLSKIIHLDAFTLVVVRIMFSIFFVYLGYYYRNFVEDKIDIFTYKWFWTIIVIQSVLWLFNRDFDPEHGIGLSYVLVWARFDQQLVVPVITALTGIWASLWVLKITYPYLKDSKFVRLMGENTYHIMANHLLVMYISFILTEFLSPREQSMMFTGYTIPFRRHICILY